jgi:Histidine kinase-like ATPase domain
MTSSPLISARAHSHGNGAPGPEWLAAAAWDAGASAAWQPGAWARSPRLVTRVPGADPGAVRAARHFALMAMRRWDQAHRCDDVAVVVSELVTNALRHAAPEPGGGPIGWPIWIGLLRPGPCVLCVVADPSPEPPLPRAPGWLAESGRGLQVIGALSDAWGCTPLGSRGKSVWASFADAPRC